MSAAFLLATVLGAEPTLGMPESSYFALSSDKALDCIESWVQLCSVPPGPWFNVTIHEDSVDVAPYMDGGATFRIVKRGPGSLELAFGRCEYGTCPEGEGATARLTSKPYGEATWDGADVSQILKRKKGAARSRIHVDLVGANPHLGRHDELERELVPFGRCGEPMFYRPVGGRRCINRPEDRPTSQYATMKALRALDCVEAWEQVCAAEPGATGELQVRVWNDRAEVGPSAGRVVMFRVAKSKEGTLQLVFERCISGDAACARLGKGTTARLEERPDGFATLEGVDVAALLGGKLAQTRVELVGFPIYWARVDKLQRQFVPGGRCEALRSYTVVGGKPCLGGPAAVDPSR